MTTYEQLKELYPDDTLFWYHHALNVNENYHIPNLLDIRELDAIKRLDDMVEAGNKRQEERMRTYLHPWWPKWRDLQSRIDNSIRSYAEQKALWERWREGKGIAFAVPGRQSHHLNGIAIDLDGYQFDAAGRHISDFAEPWHFEYTTPVKIVDDRTWFEKARDRFAARNLRRHMRKAGML